MSQDLFYALSALRIQDSLSPEELKRELSTLVQDNLTSPRLRVLVRFLSILESVMELPEYTEDHRSLIFRGIDTLHALLDERLSKKDGAKNINFLAVQAREALKPLFHRGVLCSEAFYRRLAWDLSKDSDELQHCIGIDDTQKALFLLRMIKDDFAFAGLKMSAEAAETIERLQEGADHGAFSPHSTAALQAFGIFLKESAEFFQRNKSGREVIVRREEQLSVPAILENQNSRPAGLGATLTSEEVSALLDEETPHTTLFTALEGQNTPSYQPKAFNPEEHRELSDNEDRLVKLAGKLFLKQELLKGLVPKEQKILAGEGLESLEQLTKKLKEDLFKNYYISLKSLLGQSLREFVQNETDRLGKKVKLTLRGENNEILSREGAFVKDLIFQLAANSMSYSIEMPERRRALDKSESGRLALSFEDMGGEFQASIQDDGRGFNESTMDFDTLRSSLAERGGSLEVESIEGESLKVTIRFPMKKLITKSILCRCGDLFLLMPFRNIMRIAPAESLENPAVARDPSCLGQISLAALLGAEKCSQKMALACAFGEQIIVYTVEEVLGEMEALVEESEVPLPPCCDGAVILSGDRIGFLLNERLLFNKSQSLMAKRRESLKALA